MHALFFWFFSIGMILFALAVVFNRNAVASALCFTFTIVFMAGLFVMLSAFFLAAVQILVTAGAVMVLFLFIIMLLDLTAMEHAPRHWMWMVFSGVLALAFLGLVGKTLATMTDQPVDDANSLAAMAMNVGPTVTAGGKTVDTETQSAIDKNDDTHQIGRLLFKTKPNARAHETWDSYTSYVAPFEITSLLILVATIGIIVLCKQDDRSRPHRREDITREAPPVRESALKS
jgi:NADH:ubiquinone oxidoreductase subunit 6 (subunit J)